MKKEPKNPDVYIVDMLREIEVIERHVTKKEQLFDELVSRAVLRSFTVLGEAAKRVDDATKATSAHIPWQKIIDTRNFLSHEYEEINLHRIWEIVEGHFPSLKSDLLKLYKILTGTDYHAH